MSGAAGYGHDETRTSRTRRRTTNNVALVGDRPDCDGNSRRRVLTISRLIRTGRNRAYNLRRLRRRRLVGAANGIDVRVSRDGRRRHASGSVSALPGEPRQLGPSADRRAGGDQACHHVRQRRSRRHHRDDARTPSRRWRATPLPSSTRWASVRPICSASRSAASSPNEIALSRPAAVRRLVLASSAPQGAEDMHGWAPDVIEAVGSRCRVPREYSESSTHRHRPAKQAGQQSLGRICAPHRPTGTRPTTWETRLAQYDAVCAWGIPNHPLLQRDTRDQGAGLHRQRRRRPNDPAAFLLPARRPHPAGPGQDLPRLGPRIPLPAPHRIRRRCRQPSSMTTGCPRAEIHGLLLGREFLPSQPASWLNAPRCGDEDRRRPSCVAMRGGCGI